MMHEGSQGNEGLNGSWTDMRSNDCRMERMGLCGMLVRASQSAWPRLQHLFSRITFDDEVTTARSGDNASLFNSEVADESKSHQCGLHNGRAA